ncbi:MAG: holo-ACP synthase [Clostridia bacterium]|nr:holo-ACP synthase [Clostridia bacterium]
MELLHGIDLERISRFEKLVGKPYFLRGVYTPEEQARIRESACPARKAAGLFSAKEAVSKAFGRGLYGMLPREIEILHDSRGRPLVRLHGQAAAVYGAYTLSLSLSYKDDHVVSSCIAYLA